MQLFFLQYIIVVLLKDEFYGSKILETSCGMETTEIFSSTANKVKTACMDKYYYTFNQLFAQVI